MSILIIIITTIFINDKHVSKMNKRKEIIEECKMSYMNSQIFCLHDIHTINN